MSNPIGSPMSKLGRYRCSNPSIVPCERGDYTHSSIGDSHTLREVILTGVIVVSNCEVTEITVHTYRGGAFYHGSVAGDAEAQSVLCEGERANLDSWLRDDLDSMPGQGYAVTFASRYWNTQVSVFYLESVAGDELLSDSVRGPSRKPSPDRFLPSRQYSGGA